MGHESKQPSLEQLIDEVLGPEQAGSSSDDAPIDGSVAVYGGAVVVENPQSGGKYATIEPSVKVRVTVNGEPVADRNIVTKDDDIGIEVIEQEPHVEMDIEVTNDKLKAFIIIDRQIGRQYKLKDLAPCSHATLHVDTVAEIPPPKVSPNEVKALLEEKGIKCGIIESAIFQICQTVGEGKEKMMVAEGQLPKPSVDGFIEYIYTKKNKPIRTNPYGKPIDSSVEVGEILAIKHSARKGFNGVNIFNEIAEANQPKDIPLIVGEGVRLLENETLAVAAIAGRPVVEGRGEKRLKVLPVYMVPGDVDVNLGSITFKGDIVVQGSVMESFRLVAGGDIVVYGNVLQAELVAEGNIIVHNNLISSEVNAGTLALTSKQIIPRFKKISALLDRLLQAMKVLKSHEAFKLNDLASGEGRLVQLLIDTKFKNIPLAIEEIFEIVRSTKLAVPAELRTILELLPKLTGLNPLRFESEQEVADLLRTLETSCKEMEENYGSLEPSYVTASYIQNSVVKSSGDIAVTGRGVITSDLLAIDNINIVSSKSVVRGGRVSARGTIRLNELGSNGNVTCSIVLQEQSKLEAKLVHPAVSIISGFGKYKFEDMSRSVVAYVSSKGILEVEKLKA